MDADFMDRRNGAILRESKLKFNELDVSKSFSNCSISNKTLFWRKRNFAAALQLCIRVLLDVEYLTHHFISIVKGCSFQ